MPSFPLTTTAVAAALVALSAGGAAAADIGRDWDYSERHRRAGPPTTTAAATKALIFSNKIRRQAREKARAAKGKRRSTVMAGLDGGREPRPRRARGRTS